jgi:two-component system sensor histidine kinase ChiS
MMMKNLVIKYCFFLVVLFSAVIACAQAPSAQKGIIDLRNQEFSEKPISLSGEWLFFWKQLIKPGDASKTSPSYVHCPSLWKNDSINGKPSPRMDMPVTC